MRESDEDDLTRWSRDVAQAQRKPAAPQRIADVVSRLMSRRGYAYQESSQEWESLWRQVAGSTLAGQSRVGNFRRSVLEIIVHNSSVVQELGFQKKGLLGQLRQLAGGVTVKDLRFRVGPLE